MLFDTTFNANVSLSALWLCSPFRLKTSSTICNHPQSPCDSQGSFQGSSSVTSLDSFTKDLAAYDRVSVSQNPHRDPRDSVVETLDLSRRRLYLHELAVAASHLHRCCNFYKLFSVNCYWFSRSLMGQASFLVSNRAGHWSTITPVCRRLKPKDEEALATLNDNVSCLRKDMAVFSEKVSHNLYHQHC
jgi:hypothetical protein